jgi:hypothetical protein
MSNLSNARIASILNRRPVTITVCIESGTFEAATTKLLASWFPVVHSIELDSEQWARNLREQVESLTPFHLHFGDSSDLVARFSYAFSDRPVFWYLDAHFVPGTLGTRKLPVTGRGKFPLWTELAILAKRTTSDIVVVDDVHAFEREGDQDWEFVSRPAIEQCLGHRVVASEIIGDQFVAWMNDDKPTTD